jgi:hypothetical protein
MAWTNGPLTLYHGTTGTCADAIEKGGLDLSKSRAANNFGRGVYLTSIRRQAEEHANRVFGEKPKESCAALMIYSADIALLSQKLTLCFVSPSRDWEDFVVYCRGTLATGTYIPGHPYEVVFGPLRADDGSPHSPMDFEQVSFHSRPAIGVISLTQVIKAPNLTF